jgi:hypothetical protein
MPLPAHICLVVIIIYLISYIVRTLTFDFGFFFSRGIELQQKRYSRSHYAVNRICWLGLFTRISGLELISVFPHA